MVQPLPQLPQADRSFDRDPNYLATPIDIFTGEQIPHTVAQETARDSEGRLHLGAISSRMPQESELPMYEVLTDANRTFLARARDWGKGILGLVPTVNVSSPVRLIEQSPDNVYPHLQQVAGWLDTKQRTDRH